MAVSFKGAHFPQDIILTGVRWYVAYPLSTRHVEELMRERGVHVDHATINRWVIRQNNGGFIPNYGERYRAGERISTGFVESTVNQVVSKRFCKKQQMAWTPRGAHLLLQIRTRVLNGDWEATFREWYPGFRVAPQSMAA
jgi:hypothetical protein